MIVEIIISALIFMIVFPVKVNFCGYLNFLRNRGAVFVALWNKIPLVQEKFVIAQGEVTTKNNKNKEKTIELSQSDQDVLFIEIFSKSFARKMILSRVQFFFDMGKKDDAFVASVGTGTLQVLANIILNILQTKKNGFECGVYCNALFLTDKITLTLAISGWTNVFDLVFTLLKSKLKAKKRIKEVKK